MMTLAQLYNLGISQHTNIFDGLKLPEGSPLDRDTLVNVIMEKCGLNIPMYADVFVMRSAITLWSAKHQYTFQHVGKIFEAEYSPIENTDRYETVNVTRDRDLTDDTESTSTKGEDATTTNTNLHGGRDVTHIDETTSADNVDDYQPKDHTQTTADYNSTLTDTGALNKSTTVNGTNSKIIGEDETTETTTHMHGNIGVSTNNKLQTEEYTMLSGFNPFDFLAGLFENELTLYVY